MKRSTAFIFAILATLSLSISAHAQEMADYEPLNNPQLDFPGSPEKPLTRAVIAEAAALNRSGQVFEAWSVLAKQRDGYAISATRIFGSQITVERCVVESNWHLVVGDEVRSRLFLPYAKLYQSHYIDFLASNHRYPNTLEIEKMYQQADIELGLPQSVSVDLMMNLVPLDWGRKIFFDELSSLIHIGRSANPKRWFHYTKISDARVSPVSITAQDITVEQAKHLYKKSAGEIAKCMTQILKPTTPNEDIHD